MVSDPARKDKTVTATAVAVPVSAAQAALRSKLHDAVIAEACPPRTGTVIGQESRRPSRQGQDKGKDSVTPSTSTTTVSAAAPAATRRSSYTRQMRI